MNRYSTQYGGGNQSVIQTETTRVLAVTALVLALVVGGLVATASPATATVATANETNQTTQTMVPPTTAVSAADAPPAATATTQQGLPAVTGPATAAGVVAGVGIAAGLFARQQG